MFTIATHLARGNGAPMRAARDYSKQALCLLKTGEFTIQDLNQCTCKAAKVTRSINPAFSQEQRDPNSKMSGDANGIKNVKGSQS
jgi:hypothetical protein